MTRSVTQGTWYSGKFDVILKFLADSLAQVGAIEPERPVILAHSSSPRLCLARRTPPASSSLAGRMPSCCAQNCTNRTRSGKLGCEDISWHRFPLQDAQLLRSWLTNLGRADFVPTTNSRLCSEHFTEDSFVEVDEHFAGKRRPARRLKSRAVPTVFAQRPVHTSSSKDDEVDEEQRKVGVISIFHFNMLGIFHRARKRRRNPEMPALFRVVTIA